MGKKPKTKPKKPPKLCNLKTRQFEKKKTIEEKSRLS